MAAVNAHMPQEQTTPIAQPEPKCATPLAVPNHCTGLGPSSRDSSSQPTVYCCRFSVLHPRSQWKSNLNDSPVAPLSLAEALERLTRAEQKLSQFQSWLSTHAHNGSEGERDARSRRAELRLLEFGVDDAKRACRATALAQQPAAVREQFVKVRAQLATALRMTARGRQLTKVGTTSRPYRVHYEDKRDKRDTSRGRVPQSSNGSRERATAKQNQEQSEPVAPDPISRTTTRVPPSIQANQATHKQHPANMPQRSIAPAAGLHESRALKTCSFSRCHGILQVPSQEPVTSRCRTSTNTAITDAIHKEGVHSVNRWIDDSDVDGKSHESPLSQPTATSTDKTATAREKSSSADAGGRRTGSSTPATGLEPRVNAGPQFEHVQVQAVAPEVGSLAKTTRNRSFWRRVCSCCAQREHSGSPDPSKVPTGRPKDKKEMKKVAKKAVTKTMKTATTTGAQATGASGSVSERMRDGGNEQVDRAHKIDCV